MTVTRQIAARRSVLRLGLWCAALVSGACTPHRVSYPTGWSPMPTTTQQACEQVAGRYRALGETSDQGLTHRGVSIRGLFGDDSYGWQASEATLSFPRSGRLQVSVSGTDGHVFTRILAATGQPCQDGRVIVRFARWHGGAVPGIARDAWTLELQRTDGHLIVSEAWHTFILAEFLIPLTDRAFRWHRFEVLQSQ